MVVFIASQWPPPPPSICSGHLLKEPLRCPPRKIVILHYSQSPPAPAPPTLLSCVRHVRLTDSESWECPLSLSPSLMFMWPGPKLTSFLDVVVSQCDARRGSEGEGLRSGNAFKVEGAATGRAIRPLEVMEIHTTRFLETLNTHAHALVPRSGRERAILRFIFHETLNATPLQLPHRAT